MGNDMALNVQMILSENRLIGEKIVTPRLVNQQTLDYDTFCDYLAQGSTVTAADVSAVMKQLEKNIPLILGLNARIIASPEGLVFRPTVKGSITQSQLKAKLEARKQAYLDAGDEVAAAKIDTERALTVGDLATSDLKACIVIDLPKKWDTRFQQAVEFKRVAKGMLLVTEEETPNDPGTGSGNGSDNESPQTYTLLISSANTDQGSVNSEVNQSYEAGTTVTITATPASGYAFDRWSDGNTSASRTVTMNSDLTLVASFKTSSGSEEPPFS